ncbi:MAG TPA: peroxiredoxin [Bryobacteraceae bacterium]|nr:peroxiredoxin [Bryobacteraceae bacterium]
MPLLEPATPAPDFELPDSNGAPVRLSALRGHPVVIYFYPKDDTSVCTKQACTFRDRFPEFESNDARILGISDDSTASHAKFASKYALPFTLLSDKGGAVRTLYGVTKKFGLIPGRVTYVIDRDGKIRHVYSALSESEQHVAEALRALANV